MRFSLHIERIVQDFLIAPVRMEAIRANLLKELLAKHGGWIDADYPEYRNRMLVERLNKIKLLTARIPEDYDHKTLINPNWPGIILSDDPLTTLVYRERFQFRDTKEGE